MIYVGSLKATFFKIAMLPKMNGYVVYVKVSDSDYDLPSRYRTFSTSEQPPEAGNFILTAGLMHFERCSSTVWDRCFIAGDSIYSAYNFTRMFIYSPKISVLQLTLKKYAMSVQLLGQLWVAMSSFSFSGVVISSELTMTVSATRRAYVSGLPFPVSACFKSASPAAPKNSKSNKKSSHNPARSLKSVTSLRRRLLSLSTSTSVCLKMAICYFDWQIFCLLSRSPKEAVPAFECRFCAEETAHETGCQD